MRQVLTRQWVTTDFDEDIAFFMRGMNGLEYIEYSSYRADPKTLKKGQVSFSREQQIVALRTVTDWRGIMDGKEPAEFSQEALQEKLDLETISWLLTKIVMMSTTSTDAEKN